MMDFLASVTGFCCGAFSVGLLVLLGWSTLTHYFATKK